MKLSFRREPLPRANGEPVPPTALDPAYVWAAATRFRHYGGRIASWYLAAFEIPMPRSGPKNKEAIQAHCAGLFEEPHAQRQPLWWNEEFVYGTALLDPAGLARLELLAAGGAVRRFEVALAPEAARPASAPQPLMLAKHLVHPAKCQGKVLLGVVDNGCPFASTRLRIAGGTRVLNFWDQDGAFDIPGAGAPSGWGFGSCASHTLLDAYCGNTAPGDDWTLYQNAGLPQLCRDASHGAHILGCLLGANDNSTLLWNGVRGHAPEPQPAPQPATPDLVFVQLPAAYVQGVPRTALGPYRLAALRYILACAGPATKRVVVPISSEHYEGSHDGLSLFDQASDALVQFAKGLGKKLAFLVAAGNSLRTDTNDRVPLAPGAGHEFRVRVLPGNERHTFVELWLPGALDGLGFDLRPPGAAPSPAFFSGDGCWIAPDPAGNPLVGIVSLQQPAKPGLQRCVLFIIPPTSVLQGFGGAVGDWVVSVRAPAAAGGNVFAWIARSTRALGGKARSYQSTFPRQYSWDWDFIRNVPADAGAARPYDPYSLSGLATPGKSIVVGGYRLRTGDRALYSAGGPGRPPSRHATFLIDSAAPSDQSRVVPGILGWGNRSAGFVRLAGTSVAAPFAARVFARLGTLPLGPPRGRSDPQVAVADIIP